MGTEQRYDESIGYWRNLVACNSQGLTPEQIELAAINAATTAGLWNHDHTGRPPSAWHSISLAVGALDRCQCHDCIKQRAA